MMSNLKKPFIISLCMGLLMILAAYLAIAMEPQKNYMGPNKVNLEKLIPSSFNNWKLDTSIAALVVNPDTQGELHKIYNQVVSRTYVNDHGDKIMLSIAYGSNQSTDLHIHRPEICYSSSGFSVGDSSKAYVDSVSGKIPVLHLVAQKGSRNEPITYWIRVGDTLTRGWIEQKLAAIGYGLNGIVPDGLLFRISSISNDVPYSFRIQQLFLSDLLRAIPAVDRHWLIGNKVTNNHGARNVLLPGIFLPT
jgi:EpsI family protein